MSVEPNLDETTPHFGLEEGRALVNRAKDTGAWDAVITWLAHHPDLAEQLARYIRFDQLMEGAVSPAATARVGAVLGDFELLEEIGRGAMGVVYKARQVSLERIVAVKVVPIAGLRETDLARVRFEADAMAGLSHRNVVLLYGFGKTAAEMYFAMPLMSGSLAKRMKDLGPDRQLSPREAAEIVRDIALGAHHAHQSGLIHRDLKPANILLDRDQVPHVADFGLARRADATASAVAGSPAYMAPEQARGERRLTTAADIHALGAILFELLTGRAPFVGDTVPTVIQRVIEEPAPSVGSLRPDIPRDLQLICARCLRKSPQERYPSAQALAEDLTKYLKGEPITDSRGWVWGSVSRALGWQRHTGVIRMWYVPLWGSMAAFLSMLVMQVAQLLHAPLWVSQTAIIAYLAGWLGVMWMFLVARRDMLNPVERASTALHFGAKFACVAILPVQLWLHGGDPVYVLPMFLTIVGVVVFAHGVIYWGRFYLVGLAELLAAAAMPLIPQTYWPSIYGVIVGGLQFWAAVHLKRSHQSFDESR